MGEPAWRLPWWSARPGKGAECRASGESHQAREAAEKEHVPCTPVEAKFQKTESGLERRQADHACGEGRRDRPDAQGAALGVAATSALRTVVAASWVSPVRPDRRPLEHVWAGYVCATRVKGEGSRGPSSGCSSCSWVSMLMTRSPPGGPAVCPPSSTVTLGFRFQHEIWGYACSGRRTV